MLSQPSTRVQSEMFSPVKQPERNVQRCVVFLSKTPLGRTLVYIKVTLCLVADSCTTTEMSFQRAGYLNCWSWKNLATGWHLQETSNQKNVLCWKLLGVNIRKSRNSAFSLINWTRAFFPQMVQLGW